MVKVDGATPKKGGLVRGPDKPIYTRKRRRKPGRLKEKRNKKCAKKV